MGNVTVIGAQWGDEGKGKIVDWLAERADVVVRFQGGHNAGHTLVVGNNTYKLALVPSGVVRGTLSVIGSTTRYSLAWLAVLLIPLLTLMADFMGVIGGAVVSTQVLMVDSFAYWQHSREYVGSADLFAGVFKRFPDAHFGDARHFLAGDRGVSEWIFTGTTAEGKKLEVNGCDVFTFKKGKIAVKNSYFKNRSA